MNTWKEKVERMKDEYLEGEGWCMTSSSSLDYSVYRCDSSGLKSLLQELTFKTV